VRELSRLRQREQLPVLLRRLAAQTAGVLNITRAAGEAELDRAGGILAFEVKAAGQVTGRDMRHLRKLYCME